MFCLQSLVSTCPSCFETTGHGCLVLGFQGKSWRSWRQNYFEERCLGKPTTSQEAWKIGNAWMVSRMEPCNFPDIFPLRGKNGWGERVFWLFGTQGFFIANILDFRRSSWVLTLVVHISWDMGCRLQSNSKTSTVHRGFFAPGLVFFLSHFFLFSLQGSFWIHLRSWKFYHLGLFPEE